VLQKLWTPRWIITTLLVIAGVIGMIRLGLWQLDRLEERRAFNKRVIAQVNAPVLDLPSDLPEEVQSLYDMEYRRVTVSGEYDHSGDILLRNQVWNNQPGYHIFTPLKLTGTQYSVLVDRGFILMQDGAAEKRSEYSISSEVQVTGILLRPRVPRFAGVPDPTLSPGETHLDTWNAIRLDRIQLQVSGTLLPVYVLAAPDPAEPGPPYASLEDPDLSEGPHMGYALQWFSFAAVLAVGYPFFVRKQFDEKGMTETK